MNKQLKNYYRSHDRYVYNLKISKNESIGEKALNLRFLQNKGFNIPKTYVIIYLAFDEYNQGNHRVLDDLKEELKYYINENNAYSIRSSADIEDNPDKSFAGQFKTLLNQEGINEIITSVEKIWESVNDNRVRVYSEKFSQKSSQIKMATVIQEMVNAEFSGVCFTRNPITGLNEVIVESVEGLGESLVQLGLTPERWVNKWGDWIEKPPLSEVKVNVIKQVVVESKRIAKKYGGPVDLEWAYDGSTLYWLQLRKITTLKNNKLYSNRLSKEYMPGMIKPLIWSVNIPVVNSSWKRIFEQLIGTSAKKIDINKLAHPFYYRSYFNMKIMGDVFELLGMPRDLLETLAGIDSEGKDKPSFKPSGRTLYYLPRMLLFGIKMLFFSKNIEKFLRKYKKEYDAISEMEINSLTIEDCLMVIDKLFQLNTQASYYVILTQLLNSLYNNLIKRKLKKNHLQFEAMDFSIFNKRLKYIDTSYSISKLHKFFQNLKELEKEIISTIDYDNIILKYSDFEFIKGFQRFLEKFGYLRDSGNDFSQPSWKEIPDLLLKMIIDYKEPSINNNKTSINTQKLINNVFKSPLSKFLFNRAIKYLEYRQTVTNTYSYGYGLFRVFFLKVADFFKSEGFIEEIEDIFYLKYYEIKELIKNNQKMNYFRDKIYKIKSEMIEFKNIKLPEIIYDDYLPKPLNATSIINELKGVPTSKGYYIGPVKIVEGINDINKIKEGDIIVIPYSDVSWTPLFTKARAVISESGGILSHCSIVAREYNIPAIVSVKGATSLKDNTLIALDAFNGKISILSDSFKLNELEVPIYK